MVQTKFKGKQLVPTPVTGEVPVFQADGSMASGAGGDMNAAGADTQVQFNDGGPFGAEAGMTYNKAGKAITLTAPSTNKGTLGGDALLIADASANGKVLLGIATGGAQLVLNNATDDSVHILNSGDSGSVVFNNLEEDIDLRVASDGQANMFFVDASEDKIGVGTNTPAYDVDVEGDIATESLIVNSSTANSGGGLKLLRAEATSGALAGAGGTIEVNIPVGARVHSAQLRVDTAITGDGGYALWQAQYAGGSVTQLIVGAGTNTKNDKFNTMYEPNTTASVADAETDITLTPVGGNFTAGVIRAIVYYWDFIAMDNNP